MVDPQSQPDTANPSSFWTSRPFRILIVVIVLAISILISYFRNSLAQLAAIGYPGIFLVSLLSSATIILPAPSLLLVIAMGSAFPPLLVGLAAGAGEALGELTGYAAGFGGRALIENEEVYGRLVAWMQHRGGITIFVLSVIPNPVFDLAGIAAGSLRYPVWRFLLFCWIGKTIKTTLFALGGSQLIGFVEQFIR
jgi:membrane protein YqaA with SNARE-associated domain